MPDAARPGPTYCTLVSAPVFDRPRQPVPVFAAAGGPRMARYAGEQADGMICTAGKGMTLYTERLMPAVAGGEAKAGRPPGSAERMIEVKLSYDRDPRQAPGNTLFRAPLSLAAEQKLSVGSAAEMGRLAGQLPIEQAAARWIAASDPEDAAEQIKLYAHTGRRRDG